jgi:hypothetical protein
MVEQPNPVMFSTTRRRINRGPLDPTMSPIRFSTIPDLVLKIAERVRM